MNADQRAERALASYLEELGPSKSVERFLQGYGNVRTRLVYTSQMVWYLRWLKEKGSSMNADELIQDNLRAIFESKPTDITAKRKHTDLLGEYINSYLMGKDASESKRKTAAAAVRGFYEANDSPLFGHWKQAEQKPDAPAPPLHPDDIRKVLKAMTVRMRTPLIIAWQSGMEINRVLDMEGDFALEKTPPLKVELHGRKRHRRTYSTFIGKDSVEHLRLLGPSGMPRYGSLCLNFKDTAGKLARKGVLTNADLRSYHPHYLRHSFETEAAHAGVRAEFRDFFEGHVQGIRFVYDHQDVIHPEDLVKEWAKIERARAEEVKSDRKPTLDCYIILGDNLRPSSLR